MVDKSKNTDKLFRKGLSHFNPEPPDHVWESIFNSLEESKPIRKHSVLFKVAASFAALIIPSLLLLWLYTSNTDTIEFAEENIEALTPGNPYDFLSWLPNEETTSANAIGDIGADVYYVAEELPAYEQVEMPAPVILQEAETADEGSLVSRYDDIAKNIPATMPHSDSIDVFAQSNITIPETNVVANRPDYDLLEQTLTFDEGYSSDNSGYVSHLAVTVAPQYTYNSFNTNYASQSFPIPFESLEDNLNTYNFSLSYSIESKSRFSFETGVNYFSIGRVVNEILSFGIRPELFIDEQTISEIPSQAALTSMGHIEFSSRSHYFADIISYRITTEKDSPFNEPVLLEQTNDKVSQFLSFIEVPLIMKYSLARNNFANLSVKIGMSGSYLVSNNVYLGEGDFGLVVGKTQGINDFSLAGIGGLSLEIPVAENLNVLFQPTIKAFITPLAENQYMGNIYPVSFSLNTGLAYSF